MEEKIKKIDKHLDKILEDKKISCGTKISETMKDILLRKACSQNMDLSEYFRMIIALYTMDEIVEQEVNQDV